MSTLLANGGYSFKSKAQLKFVTEILGNGLTPPLSKFTKKTDQKVYKGILRIYEYALFGSVDLPQGTEKKTTVKHEDPKVDNTKNIENN